jgi:hypothetical protein
VIESVGSDFAHICNGGSPHHVCECTWGAVEVLPGCVSALGAHSVLGGVAIIAMLLF